MYGLYDMELGIDIQMQWSALNKWNSSKTLWTKVWQVVTLLEI